MKEIRWKQRYDNLDKAYKRLNEGVKSIDFDLYHELRNKTDSDLATEAEITRINEMSLSLEGVIQRFEYTYELFINTLRDLLLYHGIPPEFLKGPRLVLEHSLQNGWISDHDGWRRMMKSRNLTSHTYNEATADLISTEIQKKFLPLMSVLFKKLTDEYNQAS